MITKRRTAIIFISLAVFAIIAASVASHDYLSFDTVIRNWVYSRRTDALSSIIIPITYSGNVQTVFALGVILMLWKKTRKTFGTGCRVYESGWKTPCKLPIYWKILWLLSR